MCQLFSLPINKELRFIKQNFMSRDANYSKKLKIAINLLSCHLAKNFFEHISPESTLLVAVTHFYVNHESTVGLSIICSIVFITCCLPRHEICSDILTVCDNT